MTTNSGTIFKWSVVLIMFIGMLWLMRQAGCIGGRKAASDTVSVRIDTTYILKIDTLKFETLVPYKVQYVKEKILHDTLIDFKTISTGGIIDSAWIADHKNVTIATDQYFATRFYNTVSNVQYGTATINDTVTQNRIVGRSVILNQNIPVAKETVTLTQPKRVVLFFGIQAIGNKQSLPFASGATLDLKFKNDGMIGIGGYLTRNDPMYSISAKFPIRLRKR